MQGDIQEQQIKQRTDNKIAENNTKGPHTCLINHREYLVFAGVFSPSVFPSTQWFTNSLIKHIGQVSSFLEIGAGIGATLIEVSLAKKCGLAMGTDINQIAVENIRANLQKFGLPLRAQHSDVFDNFSKDLKFDAIYWNFPFHFKSEKQFEEMDGIERSVRDPHYSHLSKYLMGARHYLNEKGRLFVTFSKTFGNEPKLQQIASAFGWSYKVIEQTEVAGSLQSPTLCLIEFFFAEL